MRRIAPELFLQGDQRKAKKWIPWATKALARIKNLTFAGVANNILRPVAGVAIHVRSVNNIDFIRIVVAQEKPGCHNTITQVPVAFPSPFEIGLVNDHYINGKRLTEPTDYFMHGFYNFGDGQAVFQGGVEGQKNHTYPSAGDYDVTLWSIRRVLYPSDAITVTSVVVTNADATFTIDTTGFEKSIGQLSFLLHAIITVADLASVTIDGVPVEITTNPSTPTRSVNIVVPAPTGGIMTAVVTLLVPYPVWTGWIALTQWYMIKYKCLATTTKTITVT